ncbi:sedoheptulose 7-phosphate cyclase [Streptomyces hygroscopicus subsp. hygroscopicus]|uniref:2-epi-5-epi-valiolone synthase n=1 Tax=Streptomyces demainii TaxID=588122 RepID=A0ABT9KVY5_9ACTN|nr:MULTISPECIES: sedoheptulose 7-phosphate cyclase [Streptomyces]MBW8087251.1 sedoheptulose 7-phosphate cyclase [Streptomyces hygroscopicus subsp. hygroscopicus]MCO8307322.1 sedoheptulose 7-phosphate cyclase [Streptomyces sp. RKCA744]MDP9612593.1 3-dehydroquinate synthase [Streptomyces demainii]
MSGQVLAPVEPGVREDATGFGLLAPDGTAYRVDLVRGVFDQDNPLLARALAGRRVVAFVSPTVDRLYGDRLRAYLNVHADPGSWSVHAVRTGEHHKTLGAAEQVCATAKAAGLDRHGVMLAVGGGIVADVVGFAASMYARGVRYIKINTTLVGQVDVGVGVKTGVNALQTKNMFGAYHPAHASLNDPGFLATLPPREIRCGLAEIVKMAVILDEDLLRTLERYPDVFLGPPGGDGRLETYVLRTSMRLMMEELCPNLREHQLARLVDFGHTFSPVIETAGDHRLEHGEAVAVDMALSAHIARLLGLTDTDTCERIVRLLRRIGLPVHDARTCTPELMSHALRASWERRGRRLHLVVPTAPGKAAFVDELEDVPEPLLRAALDALARDGERHDV